ARRRAAGELEEQRFQVDRVLAELREPEAASDQRGGNAFGHGGTVHVEQERAGVGSGPRPPGGGADTPDTPEAAAEQALLAPAPRPAAGGAGAPPPGGGGDTPSRRPPRRMATRSATRSISPRM